MASFNVIKEPFSVRNQHEFSITKELCLKEKKRTVEIHALLYQF